MFPERWTTSLFYSADSDHFAIIPVISWCLVPRQATNLITKRELLTMDPDTDDEQLVYEITAEPKHGFLESKQKPGNPVTTFTQGTGRASLCSFPSDESWGRCCSSSPGTDPVHTYFKEIPLKNVVTESEFKALMRSVLVVFQPLVEPTKGILK